MQLQFPKMPEQITKSEARILDFISNNTDEFIFAPISTVSRRLGVSAATISRFVRHVGCRDYKELKRIVAGQNSSEEPAVKMIAALSPEGEFSLKNWILRQQTCLQKTLERLDQKAFRQAVSALLSAHRVFIHAKSAASSLGRLLKFRLRRLGVETVLLPSGGSEVLEGLAQVREDDLVVMFSFSKVSKEGRMILDYRRQAGYRTIAFCSRMFVPEEERADIQLFVYRGESEEYHSMTAPAAVVDALVIAVSEQMGAESARRLSELQSLKKRYAPDRQRVCAARHAEKAEKETEGPEKG